jgi:phosphatidate cytidylyltransferase
MNLIDQGAWASPLYAQTVLKVLMFLFISGIVVFFFRKKNYYFVVSWHSVRSWLFVAPVLFGLFGLAQPWPLILLTVIAVFGVKVFFQILGMFHRTYFLIVSYFGIIFLSYLIHTKNLHLYNLVPMIVLAISCLVPLIRNNYKMMIQYISLTNLCFVFLGWAFLHLGLIMQFENGVYQVMYLIILTEFCDNTTLAISKSLGKIPIFDRIDNKRTIQGFLVSSLLTIGIAFAMKYLLPAESEQYWLTAGLVASLGGIIGDMVMTVIRRDANVKVTGPFILGRGDFLHRMDRLIFVAPIYYYVMTYLVH